MSVFPNLGILDPAVVKTMKSRSNDLVETSGLMSWLRIASAVPGKSNGKAYTGLVLESIPKNSNFKSIYGTESQSGRVGLDFKNNPVHAEGAERGFRPSPIIESLAVENGTSGLSRKAKFSIKCFTLGQAELIAKHFLEPGYTVLVEYGWNTSAATDEKDDLTACYMASFNNYKFITKKRKRSGGTYDGFMGFITGGGYSSADDETYVVDVELTTLGEMPTYFQIQKTAVNKSSKSGGKEEQPRGRYSVENIEKNLENADTIGIALFKKVYNKLPNEKRTRQVKSLLNTDQKDMNNNLWSNKYNFINVDVQFREEFAKELETFKTDLMLYQTKDGNKTRERPTVQDEPFTGKLIKDVEVTIPSGVNLLSDQSFIRVELAFKILNAYGINTEPSEIGKCSGEDKVPTYNFEIEINNTICRAHKYMFSTDITKLFIPNKNHPDFALGQLIGATTTTSAAELIDLNNLTVVKPPGGNQWVDGENASEYAFPSTRAMELKDQEVINGVRVTQAPEHTWGYLRNLYINLDFFLEVISRPNFVAKDCYYELLSGMSSACNYIWDFELVERPGAYPKKTYNKTTGQGLAKGTEGANPEAPSYGNIITTDGKGVTHKSTSTLVYQMSVVDMSFTGTINIPDEDNSTDDSKRDYPVFEPNGPKTPFLTSNVIMDIPAVMKNSILGKRSSGIETSIEEKAVEETHFFATEADPVMKILDSFRVGRKIADPDDPAPEANEPDIEEIRRDNIISFTEKGQLLLLVRDPSVIKDGVAGWVNVDQEVREGQQVIVGAYDDDVLLRKIERKFDDEANIAGNNPSILAIEFGFEIHGISGIKIGDCFKVARLPKKYSTGIFQVMETSHALSDGMWKTTVKAKLRNV